MKKVLFTATVDSHILHFHLPFLKLFHDEGYEVHVATNGNEEIPFCDVKHIVSFERTPFKMNNLKAINQLKKICDKEKFDIIHTHTPMGSVVTRLAARTSRKKYNTRVIYTAHGFHFFKGAPLKNWLIYYNVEKYMAKYTDTLITINNEDYLLAKEKFSKKCNDIQYVPGVGIDTNIFSQKMTMLEKKKLRKQIGLKEKDFVLIFPARLDANKNQGFLIDAMNTLIEKDNQIHLILVGPDELNGKYQNLAKDLGLNKNVHFLGFRNDIPKLMNISNISVSSSLREGLPVNIMEAFAAGLPVVATNCRGVNDLLIDGENGFVANDREDFINKILLLKEDKALLSKICLNNLKKSEVYDVKKILKKMKKIYKR